MPHDVDGIGFAIIVASSKLSDIAVKVLLAKMMEGALISPLEHCPEAFDPVGVRLTSDILASRVIYGLVIEGHALYTVPI